MRLASAACENRGNRNDGDQRQDLHEDGDDCDFAGCPDPSQINQREDRREEVGEGDEMLFERRYCGPQRCRCG